MISFVSILISFTLFIDDRNVWITSFTCFSPAASSPAEVAASLEKRDGFTVEKSIRLWHVYTEAALEQTARAFKSKDRDEWLDIMTGLGMIQKETLGGLTGPLTFTPNEAQATSNGCVFYELLTTTGWGAPRGSQPVCKGH